METVEGVNSMKQVLGGEQRDEVGEKERGTMER